MGDISNYLLCCRIVGPKRVHLRLTSAWIMLKKLTKKNCQPSILKRKSMKKFIPFERSNRSTNSQLTVNWFNLILYFFIIINLVRNSGEKQKNMLLNIMISSKNYNDFFSSAFCNLYSDKRNLSARFYYNAASDFTQKN